MNSFLWNRCNKNKPLSEVSTFSIGGEAKWLLEVHSIQELQEALSISNAESIPFLVIGKGSNVLFSDNGFHGLVIVNKIAHLHQEDAFFEVGAGYSFSLLGVQTARKGWSGLEFASGIPASVGGAVYMNAGANSKETADCLHSVTYITESGEMETYLKEEILFSYRFSSLQTKKGAIASAIFKLEQNNEARQKQLSIIEYRKKTQPYNDPSAGCVFRNPPGGFAGALIESCGLKGLKVGGAEVSLLHANFIVNKGGATAEDVCRLIDMVKREVLIKKGVELEVELRVLSDGL